MDVLHFSSLPSRCSVKPKPKLIVVTIINRKLNRIVMKTNNQLKSLSIFEKAILSLAATLTIFLTSVKTFAQSVPDKVEVDVDAGGDAVWYGQPWVWVVGVALFIVIIIAITRNNNTRA